MPRQIFSITPPLAALGKIYKKPLILLGLLTLSACASVAPAPKTQTLPQGENLPPVISPIPNTPPAASDPLRPMPPPEAPPPIAEIYEPESTTPNIAGPDTPSHETQAGEALPKESLPGFPPEIAPNPNLVAALPYWTASDTAPALAAFQRSCQHWEKKAHSAMLNEALPEYGRYGDWAAPCAKAIITPLTYAASKDFFEQEFTPVTLTPRNNESGLMTGYYQPEIKVRRRADAYYNEPVLAVPKDKAVQNLPRAALSAGASRVIAYGRPLDVFFMQIQGSGHLRYEDGPTIRAAYAGNNGQPYRSIGKVLIERGEISKDRSSKADIERWMAENGPEKSRALMNENPRYIYFVEQKINEGEGPNGAMGVPLTAMGSMAVDPRYHPYGSLIWLQVKIPQNKGDYKGSPSGHLLAAQDTGKAIRGALRGDLYFGSGTAAGDLAGVMKHRAVWTTLLPKALAARLKDRQNNVS
jgi:membrane-bound lytic murein transglycosylase A